MSKIVDLLSEMTYQEYLDTWESQYGDATYGETDVWIYGKKQVVTVIRLPQAEFVRHRDAMTRLQVQFEEADKNGDGQAMDDILGRMFPHEVALLI